MSVVRNTWQAICAVLLGGIVLVPLVQVFMRDVFVSPLVGAEEFTRFLLVCLVFIGYPLVVNDGENIRMGELHEALSGKARRVVDAMIFLGAVFSSGFIAYATITTIFANLNNATPTLKIPFWIFLGATAVGFAVACVLHLIRVRHRVPADRPEYPPEGS